jgi:hypothetical protein
MTMDESYRRSIFAFELAAVLALHNCTIESLRRAPFTFDKDKVARLDGSQRGVAQLPALSHHELMSIVLLLKLREDERLRLYAALIALGAQRLLLDYLPDQRAWEIACEVRDAALVWLRDHGSDDDLLRRRGLRDASERERPAGDEAAVANALAQALDVYDEGIAAAALGMLEPESAWGRERLERAASLLERAEMLLALIDGAADDDDEQRQYWAREVPRALQSVRDELR